MIRERIADEIGDEALLMDGYDDCIIGYVEQYGRPPIVLYDRDLVIAKLMDEYKDDEDVSLEEVETMAWEWYEYNMIGGWVGEYTPAFAVVFKGEYE